MIVNSCGHPPAVVTSVKVTVGVRSQLSVDVADPPVEAGAELVLHWIVTFGGQLTPGATLSRTLKIWVQVSVFVPSVAI